MPNYILDELQNYQQNQANIAGQNKLNTLRDLQVQEAQQKLAPGSPEQLQRQVMGMQAQGQLDNADVYAKRIGFENKAAMVSAADDYLQNVLDTGGNAQAGVDDLASKGILPQGTRAFKKYDANLGEKIWFVQAPGQEPVAFNKDVVKARRAVATQKALTKWTEDAKANADLTKNGWRWTKDGNLELIPGGPADLAMKHPDMKGMPNIAKLQAYRQQLIDEGAPPKLIREVETAINKPETANAILSRLVAKVGKGIKLTQDELNQLDVLKVYANPIAQAISSGMEENIRNRIGGDETGFVGWENP